MKMVKDLSYDEIKTVLMNNDDLREQFAKAGYDRAMGEDGDTWYWIGEVLDGCPGQYQVSDYYDYIDFKGNYQAAVDYLRDIQHKFEYLYDEQGENNRKIDKLEKYSDILYRADNEYGMNVKLEDYYNLEKICDDLMEYFENELLRRFHNEIRYWYDTEHCIDNAIEFLDIDGFFDDLAVTDDLRTVFDINEMI